MRFMIALLAALFMQAAVAEGRGKVRGSGHGARFVPVWKAAKTSIRQFEKDNQGELDKLKGIEAELVKMKEQIEKKATS